MALQKNYTKEVYGQLLTFNQAYFQITYLQGNKNLINIQLTVYSDSSKKEVIDQINDVFVPNLSEDAKNIYKQGYHYFKSKPEFENAIDILEEGQSTL